MKNRSVLLLTEQLVMMTVFLLAAAVCLGVFVRAAQISTHTQRQDEAVALAQNAAELLKAGQMPGNRTEDGYRLEIREIGETLPGLIQGRITVYFEEEALFSLETGWQEVEP